MIFWSVSYHIAILFWKTAKKIDIRIGNFLNNITPEYHQLCFAYWQCNLEFHFSMHFIKEINNSSIQLYADGIIRSLFQRSMYIPLWKSMFLIYRGISNRNHCNRLCMNMQHKYKSCIDSVCSLVGDTAV